MATSRQWEELEWAWREWRSQTGRKIKNSYEQFVKLHNKAAQLNGKNINVFVWSEISAPKY